MPKLDLYDEAVITAEAADVYQAVVDEMSGRTDWWAPHRSMQLLAGESYDQVGAMVESTIHGKWPIRFTTIIVRVEPASTIRQRYVAGAFRGIGVWTFEPIDGGTRTSYRWKADPSGALRLFAPVLPVARSHREVMEAGFTSVNAFLGHVRRS